MPTQEIAGVAIVPAVVAIVQIIKEAGLPSRLSPLVSLLIGIVAGLALQLTTAGVALSGTVIVEGVAAGVGLGLAASGLYAGVKSISQPGPTPTPVVAPTTSTARPKTP